MELKTFEYPLINEFEIGGMNGDFESATFFTIKEPTIENINEFNRFKQETKRAIIEVQKSSVFEDLKEEIAIELEKKEADKKEKGEKVVKKEKTKDEIIAECDGMFETLCLSNINFQLCMDIFKKLIKKDGLVNDSIKINSGIIQKISIDDMNNMLGGYVNYFLLK